MTRTGNPTDARDVAEIVACYEAVRLIEGVSDLSEFLPEVGHPIRAAALAELVIVDMNYRWNSGQRRVLEDYLGDFPELGYDGLAEVALVEYRLRLESAERVSAEDYRKRFGIETFGWPDSGNSDREFSSIQVPLSFQATLKRRAPDLTGVAWSYLDFRSRKSSAPGDEIGTWTLPVGSEEDSSAAEVFRELHDSDPDGAAKLAKAVVQLPKPGESFLGFQLLGELGRGAFGRVYLASQGDLADRPVALKVSAQGSTEHQALAQLQHTNIVPIFSAHRFDPLHAVCMPYFGSTTLKDIFEELEDKPSMPTSGQSLLETLASQQSVRSTVIDSWRNRSETFSGIAECQTAPPEGPKPKIQPSPLLSSDTLAILSGLSYVDAILWIGARLADGLAHAHGRGILHRDLKPANILVTDAGQPMILDFNLSQDIKRPAPMVSIGGTLPYMAPEQLRETCKMEGTPVDTRSDVYSLGVILYELLAGRPPFQPQTIFNPSVLARMIDERSKVPTGLREHNPQVSPAVESIVKHCLEPDPAQRYQSASQLLEDIERQLAHLPLKHAPEPSIRERFSKWGKRHPRLASPNTVSIMLIFLFLGAFWGMIAQAQKQSRLEALASFAQFREEASTIRYLLNTRVFNRDRRARAVKLGSESLERYGVLVDPIWRNRTLVSSLDPSDRRALLEDIGALLLFLAKASQLDAEAFKPDDPAGKRPVQEAMRLCELSGSCFEADRSPKALLEQKAELSRLMGQAAEAERLLAEASKLTIKTALDHEIAATALMHKGEVRKALPLALEATRLDPRDFWAWFTLGISHERLNQEVQAAACFGTCIALRPDSPFGWFNRGVVCSRRADYDQARRDLDRASALDPTWPDPFIERGIVNNLDGKANQAVLDYTKAMQLGANDTRTCFFRAEARERAGDLEGARLDREQAFKREPRDDLGWFVRAMYQEEKNPAAALADLDRALAANPRHLDSLQAKAFILAERLGRNEEAEALFDRAVNLCPDHVPSRSARGVMRAILGRREAAHIDAKESLWRDTSPRILYQVAGIYAVTSKQVPDDRIEAYRLLSTALRGGFGFDIIDKDAELDAIRDQPEFRKLVEAAKALRDADPGNKPAP